MHENEFEKAKKSAFDDQQQIINAGHKVLQTFSKFPQSKYFDFVKDDDLGRFRNEWLNFAIETLPSDNLREEFIKECTSPEALAESNFAELESSIRYDKPQALYDQYAESLKKVNQDFSRYLPMDYPRGI